MASTSPLVMIVEELPSRSMLIVASWPMMPSGLPAPLPRRKSRSSFQRSAAGNHSLSIVMIAGRLSAMSVFCSSVPPASALAVRRSCAKAGWDSMNSSPASSHSTVMPP